jgi:hypothetical protein
MIQTDTASNSGVPRIDPGVISSQVNYAKVIYLGLRNEVAGHTKSASVGNGTSSSIFKAGG